jgi:protein TonB
LLRPSDIQDIIDKIAKAPTPSETEGSSITFSTQEYRYKAYMERLKQKIEGVWVYPRSAAEKGIYGDLVIQFTIRKDGSLAKAKVVRTSGYQELDEAAVKALRDGEPYWPLPAGWPEESLTINGHFIYSLWGRYLR